MFMSMYMLRAFAPHLAIVEKSCLEAHEPPFGALAMAAAAASPIIYITLSVYSLSVLQVEIAFGCFTSGTYRPPVGSLDKVGGAGLCDKWLQKGVMNLYNKQVHWEAMMDAAKAQAKSRVGGSKRGRNITIGAQCDRDVVPPSSSPVRSE